GIAALAAVTLAAATLTACSADASGSGGGGGPEVTLTVTALVPEASSSGAAAKAWGDYLEEESDGRIEIEYYWSAALVGAVEQLSGVGSGLADFAVSSYVYNPQELP